MYWKVFILTCDASAPFEFLEGKQRKDFTLVYGVAQGEDTSKETPSYSVGLEFARTDGTSEKRFFFTAESTWPIRQSRQTASDPSYHTAPHIVLNEDDILHLRRLPDFDGRLRPHSVELLLQYLTVPYLRIPLVLDFFSEDTIYALQSTKLQDLIERVLFEAGPFDFNHEQNEPLTEVPCRNVERVTSTPFGLLINELVHSGEHLLISISRLLKLTLKYDAYRADDSMRCATPAGGWGWFSPLQPSESMASIAFVAL